MSGEVQRRLVQADEFWRAMGPDAWAAWLAVRDEAARRMEQLSD